MLDKENEQIHMYLCDSLNEVSLALLKQWSVSLKRNYKSPKDALRTMNIIVPKSVPDDWSTFDVGNIAVIEVNKYSRIRKIKSIGNHND